MYYAKSLDLSQCRPVEEILGVHCLYRYGCYMNCDACSELQDVTDLTSPYVVRTCNKCGRKINLREPGENGHGIKIAKGDQFFFPNGWLKIAANPLKGNGHLTKFGLAWFAQLIFVEDIKTASELNSFLDKSENECDEILRASPLLAEFDLADTETAELVFKTLEKNQAEPEWWAYLAGTFNSIVRDALTENDAQKAVWAMRAAERCRSMYVFKTHLEEVVWMGHSASRIIQIIQKWHANKTNDNEEFWQTIFNENPYVLTQIFSVPVVFIKDKAYVGGMNIDRQDAKFVDYLYANESSNDALLIELKTPVTKLLGRKYRKGVHNPSSELSGSIVQALDYRRELSSNIKNISDGTSHTIDIFNPRCIIVVGNASDELDSDIKRKSFELFRTSLKDIEIITYDELFKKAENLASLFNLVWKTSQGN